MGKCAATESLTIWARPDTFLLRESEFFKKRERMGKCAATESSRPTIWARPDTFHLSVMLLRIDVTENIRLR